MRGGVLESDLGWGLVQRRMKQHLLLLRYMGAQFSVGRARINITRTNKDVEIFRIRMFWSSGHRWISYCNPRRSLETALYLFSRSRARSLTIV